MRENVDKFVSEWLSSHFQQGVALTSEEIERRAGGLVRDAEAAGIGRAELRECIDNFGARSELHVAGPVQDVEAEKNPSGMPRQHRARSRSRHRLKRTPMIAAPWSPPRNSEADQQEHN